MIYECIHNIVQCDVRVNVLDGRTTVGGTSLLFKSSKYFPTKFSRFVEILAHSHSYVHFSLRANSTCIVLRGGHDDYGNPWLSCLSQYAFVVLSCIESSYLVKRAKKIDQNENLLLLKERGLQSYCKCNSPPGHLFTWLRQPPNPNAHTGC